MQILIIGTGYVGLVTGVCFAEKGHHVICLDINEEKITNLKQGIIPIYEPGLEDLVLKNLHLQRLEFSTDYASSVKHAEIIFMSVATPSLEDGTADLSQIQLAALSLAEVMQQSKIIAIKSTVPPGTSQKIRALIHQHLHTRGLNITCEVIPNPEFLREGSAIEDCMHPDRIIIGSEEEKIKQMMLSIYKPFALETSSFIFMDPTSAEMTKYAANAMLASRISFMNELAGLCEKLQANIEHVRTGIGSDKRIGPQFLYAGIGFGGSCFPKDIRALKAKAQEVHYSTPLLNAIEEINAKQKKLLGEKIRVYFDQRGGVKNKTIAIWGISFKPNTDDIREAPALELIKELRSLGAHLRLFDPVAMHHAQALFKEDASMQWCSDVYEACSGADAVALLTEWKQFRSANLDQVLSSMRGNALFDGRNQYEPKHMLQKGFDYFAIGIPRVS
jgi:UDPglucose 6-dehydrogenase